MRRASDVVMEGRDIGSVVFPETPYKFYIDASPEIRRRRRAAQGQRDQIAARDRADSSRRASPLIIAEDAHVIDSSNLTIDGVVGEIIGQLKMKGMNDRLTSESLVLLRSIYTSDASWSRGFFFRFRVLHQERLIEEGPVILAMNHESYLDPPLAGIRLQTRDLFSRAQNAPRRPGSSAGFCRNSMSFRSIRKAAIAARSRR